MEESLSLDVLVKKLEPPTSIGPISSYVVPEKDKSSNFYIVGKTGFFIKEKRRNLEKTIWEFYMLYAWNKIFEKFNKKNNKNLKIKLKIPEPHYIQYIDKNLSSLYMDFVPGYPIKKYSEVSKSLINEKKIKIKKKKMNLIEIIAFGLGILDRIKSSYYLFHGDLDFRHILFDSESLTLSVVDLEKAFIYTDKYDVDEDTLKKAIEKERKKLLENLKSKFSHLESFEKMYDAFNRGHHCCRIKSLRSETIFNKFYEKYKDIFINYIQPPKSVLDKIKKVIEK